MRGRVGVWACGRVGVSACRVMIRQQRRKQAETRREADAMKWLKMLAQGFSPGEAGDWIRPEGATDLRIHPTRFARDRPVF